MTEVVSLSCKDFHFVNMMISYVTCEFERKNGKRHNKGQEELSVLLYLKLFRPIMFQVYVSEIDDWSMIRSWNSHKWWFGDYPVILQVFHSTRPPEQQSIVFQFASTHGAITCAGSSDHETGEEMTEMALALVQLEDKLALHRGIIDKIMWASYGPISDFRVKPNSEENIFYVLVFMLCLGL